MSHLPWFEHFKEQLQGLTEAFEQSGSPLSLLGYALQEKRLSSDEYLQWAMKHYQLPLLQSRFFTETPVSQEMFAKWATHYPWSAECLPVAEWDGSLIVACLQPPQDFPSTPPGILILASYENMHSAWASLHPKTQPVPQIADAPEGIDLSAATVATKSSDSFSFEDLGLSAPEPAEFSLDSMNEEHSTEEAPAEKIDGLFDSPTLIRLEALQPQEGTSEPVLDKTVAIAQPPASEPPHTAATPAMTTVMTTATPPPPPKEDTPAVATLPLAAHPATPAKPTTTPISAGNFLLERMKKKNGSSLNEKVQKVLTEMKAHFEKSMILTLDEQETQLTAFAWDDSFNGVQDTSTRFPLQTPSIFNIVASTQKPFHGYISLNEINEKFFEDWNRGQVPDHVTITPLIVDEKIVGMLMGFAEKSAYNKTSLKFAEKLSGEFTKGLQAA